MRWIMLRLGQLAATIVPAPQAQGDTPRAETHTETLLMSVSGVTGWITMVGGAFLISLCFLASFIAANAWMSRQPTSLQSICSNVLEFYKNRDAPTTRNGGRNLSTCTTTARSRSTNTTRLALNTN
jgi:hypothetical protein